MQSQSETAKSPVPFETASELKEAHALLLDRLDDELARESAGGSESAGFIRLAPEVRLFLQRGAATGVFLDDLKDRTACTVLLEFWVSGLAKAGMRVSGARLEPFDSDRLPDLKDKDCPYVGLDAFRGPDFFFGREADTEMLATLVLNSPLVIVLGPSGSGKSSLVLGGVLPAVQQRASVIAVPPFVPGNGVLLNLADAVLTALGERRDAAAEAERMRTDPAHLAAMLAQHAPALIVVDQFEEVFTLCEAADRDTLVVSIVQLLAAGKGHRVIVTMREEFRSRIVELSPLTPYLRDAWYSMRPMGYEELKAAVERPAALVNLQFQPGIVDDLVKRVLGQPAALPLLQFTLRALWKARDRNRITWEVYGSVRDPLQALKTSADNFYDGLSLETQNEVRRILLQLVRVDELLEAYRQPVPESQLLKAGRANTRGVLDLLAENDYIRINRSVHNADPVVEVKHESLIRNWPRYVDWIDQKRIERRQRLAITQAAAAWASKGRPVEGLLTGLQLEDAERLQDLSKVEQEFIRASRNEIERTQRQRVAKVRRERNMWRLGFAIALVLTAVFANIAYRQYRESKRLTALNLETERRAKEATDQKVESDRLYQDALTELRAIQQSAQGQRGPGTAKTPLPLTPSRGLIFVQVSDGGQMDLAKKIVDKIGQRGLEIAKGIEKVRPVSQSDVRYFYMEDARRAQEVSTIVADFGIKASPKPIGGFENKVPKGQVEIWLGLDAGTAAAK